METPITTYQDFELRLTALIDDDYREFAKTGVTTTEYPLLGVRIPDLRALAKQIEKSNYTKDFLDHVPKSFEEVLVRGLLIANLPYAEMKVRLKSFLPEIDNWGACDTFCSAAKSIKKNRDDFLTTIDQLLESPAEFSVRVALVCLLCHYVVPDYLPVIFDRVIRVKNRKEYYIKMAIAWLLAECFIKFPDETYPLLAAKTLPKWTHNKTISKIRDSLRVAPEVKTALAALRQ